MAKLIVFIALLACVALVLAAEPEPEKKKDDLQTANSFYGFGGYPLGYGFGHGGYGGYGFPGYGYRGFYGGFPGYYGGYGFYG